MIGRAITTISMITASGLDLLTSLTLLNLGSVEQNPLYKLLGTGFWAHYVIANTALTILLLAASKKWWWTYLILWIPICVHLICTIHNFSLVM